MEHKLLIETRTVVLDKLIKVYKADPYKARVMYFNAPKGHTQERVVFYDKGAEWSLVRYQRTFGISVTNKIFNRERVMDTITYSKNKFHRIYRDTKGSRNVRLLTANHVTQFINACVSTNDFGPTVWGLIIARHSWVRFITENNVLHSRPFNTFVKHRLYNLNDSLKYFFKVPLPQAKILVQHYVGGSYNDWSEILPVLTNIENLTLETLNGTYFKDLCRMAKTLGRKVNCGWSHKRTKQEHDDWSQEIGHIVLECEEERNLKIANVYLKFAEFSGYQILKTNRDMMLEGLVQKHCVATYISTVDAGRCGIFRVKNYTLELRGYDKHWSSGIQYFLEIGQFKAYNNTEVPNETRLEVAEKVDEFNTKFLKREIDEIDKISDKIDCITQNGNPFMILTPQTEGSQIAIYNRDVSVYKENEDIEIFTYEDIDF